MIAQRIEAHDFEMRHGCKKAPPPMCMGFEARQGKLSAEHRIERNLPAFKLGEQNYSKTDRIGGTCMALYFDAWHFLNS